MKTNTEILEKIKKLLKLATGQGATPNEVAVAMGKAKALAMQHQIEISSVDTTDDTKSASGIEVEKDSTLRTRSKFRQPYHTYVANVLEEVFDVEVIWSFRRWSGGLEVTAIHIIGETTDVAIAVAIFPYLEKVFPSTLSKQVSARRLTYAAAHMNGWYLGLAKGIIEANQREKDALPPEQANQYAMVLVNKETLIAARLAVDFPKLKSAKARRREMSGEAAYLGKREGAKINLRQVGTGTAAKQLA